MLGSQYTEGNYRTRRPVHNSVSPSDWTATPVLFPSEDNARTTFPVGSPSSVSWNWPVGGEPYCALACVGRGRSGESREAGR
jgi:hypothetical protein